MFILGSLESAYLRRWNGHAEIAGVENAEVEITAPECKDGNRGGGKRGRRKSMESEGFKKGVSDYIDWKSRYDTRLFSATCGFGVQRLTWDKEIDSNVTAAQR